MLGPPIDAWYVWLGVSIVALTVLGVAVTATPSQPPEAESAAETIDTVAASTPPASGTVPVDADRVRISPHRIWIGAGSQAETRTGTRADAGDVASDSAIVERGPITPARRGSDLRAIALGTPPAAAYEASEQLAAAAADARADERVLEPADDELVVRSVEWEGVRVTIVTV